VNVRIDYGRARRSGSGGILSALRLDLKLPNFNGRKSWDLQSTGGGSAGNLLGTFHTWDLLGGQQNYNCTSQGPLWVTSAEPEHCALGLISKDGVSVVDDSLTPILTSPEDGGWVSPQLRGYCDTDLAAASETGGSVKSMEPCFAVNNPRDQSSCEAAGCCWQAGENQTSHLADFSHIDSVSSHTTVRQLWRYHVEEAVAFHLYDPSKPQPAGTVPLDLYFSESLQDHWTTTPEHSPATPYDSSGSARAEIKGASYTRLFRLGYILRSRDEFNPWCKALVEFFSPVHMDHVASVNNCSGCDATYVRGATLGWILDLYQRGTMPSTPGIIPLARFSSTLVDVARRSVPIIQEAISVSTAVDSVIAPTSDHPAVFYGLKPQCHRRQGHIDAYFFAHGDDYKRALSDYVSIAGRIPIPRRHILGVSWSRWGGNGHGSGGGGGSGNWSTMNQTETIAAVHAMAQASLPLDTFVFDMQWHRQTAWGGYSWDTKAFPDHVGLLKWLHSPVSEGGAGGISTGINLHDGDGVLPSDDRYSAMVKAMNQTFESAVPFHISDRRFASALQTAVLDPLIAEGVDFLWTDWQFGIGGGKGSDTQPGSQDFPGTIDVAGLNPTIWLNHLRFHNANGDGLSNGQKYHRRGLVLSRYGGLANHRYAVGFGGDIRQSWESLGPMIKMTVTATNVAFAYWAQEMMQDGGGVSKPELFTRVCQFGAWSPVYTNYGNGFANDNIWSLPEPYFSAIQRALAHRAMTLPYRYTLAWEAHATGLAPIRPMYYDWPKCKEAYDDSTGRQYMLGSSLLIAPVAQSVAQTVSIWFPPQTEWVDFPSFHNDGSSPPPEIRQGGTTLTLPVHSLDDVPVFVRRGSVLPMLPYKTAIKHGSASRPLPGQYNNVRRNRHEDDSLTSWELDVDDPTLPLEFWWHVPFNFSSACAGDTSSSAAPSAKIGDLSTTAGNAQVYEDDGLSDGYLHGDFNLTNVSVATQMTQSDGSPPLFCLQWKVSSTASGSGARFIFRHLEVAGEPRLPLPRSVDVNGASIPVSKCAWRDVGCRYVGPGLAVEVDVLLEKSVVTICF